MENICLETHIGADGILHLDLPVALVDTDLKVTVTCQPVAASKVSKSNLTAWDTLEAVRTNADYRNWP